MSSNKSTRAPGDISAEAEIWLDNVRSPDDGNTAEIPVIEQRKQAYEMARPASKKALRDHAVTISESEIDAIPCMVINPPERREARTLLYLFGGGFTLGSPFEGLTISAALAAKTSARVIAPAYRLAPEYPFPAALDDISAVAHEVFDSPTSACVAGESAGANLALALMHRLSRTGLAMPHAAALLSPPSDLKERGESFLAARDPSFNPSRADQIESAYIGNNDRTNPEISPIYGKFDVNFPPCLITTGTRDIFLSSAVRLARVMRKAGAPVDLRVWEGMWHVFEYYSEIPEADASLTEVAEFLGQHF